MAMLKKILFISFVLFSGSVFADDVWWHGADYYKCGGTGTDHIAGEACIGESDNDDCGTGTKGLLMMVARKPLEDDGYCATFCPTQINSNDSRETTYYDRSKGDDCVMLCREGSVANESEYCESDVLTHEDYSTYTIGTGANIEGQIPMRFYGNEHDCEVRDNEHDMILAITDYLDSGHGAYIQPVIVRANNKNNIFAYYTANPQKYKMLVCRPGYKPVAGDCVQSTNFCEFQSYFANMCTGWSSAYFDSNIHKFKQSSDAEHPNGCNIYQCKTPGDAFPDTEGNVSDYSCSKCIEVVNKDGVNPKNGACVHCETGKVFEELTNNQGYVCSDAQQLTRQELQYGKTQNISTLPLNSQCWVKDTVDDYRECVLRK